ncbi:MAG: molybdenum cofactor guanylyltransferase [Candidatus Hodarchaeales archaeon]|jgi:molybdopterin-guanine dinucleotide biosynthesis protein A
MMGKSTLSFDMAILSGGKGRQFQNEAGSRKDKALAVVNGQTILEILTDRFSGLVNHLFLICGSLERCKSYKSLLESAKKEFYEQIRFIPDIKDGKLPPGPLRGILTSLCSAISPVIVTIPIDMPFLHSDHILPLKELVAEADICTPIWPNKRLLPLIAAYQPGKVWQWSFLFGVLQRSRADDPIRAAQAVCFLPLRTEEITNQQYAFLNINTLAELTKAQKMLAPPSTEKLPYCAGKRTITPVYENRHSELVSLLAKSFEDRMKAEDRISQTDLERFVDEFNNNRMYFWEALSCELLGNLILEVQEKAGEESRNWHDRAAKAYHLEHDFWMDHNQPFLALHCLQDQLKLQDPTSKDYRNVQSLIRSYRTKLFEFESQ